MCEVAKDEDRHIATHFAKLPELLTPGHSDGRGDEQLVKTRKPMIRSMPTAATPETMSATCSDSSGASLAMTS